ncbi:PTS sugar transporter subunit IIA [Mycoplasmopsis citelli]|uniref:PTS sugar transporter subunit IIA n=1 Tax=Mycoplasmopsis citelli TaxID=171281 RepID=UPI002114F430|nr:PTS sugar transporter subunit IIA [Mycoplasmopsis citelli]UUD36184.1 PTS sugar transporter subunit IIA [Mycoplasmopsis citelli]
MKLFDPQLMQYMDKKVSWKEAIHLGVDMLVKQNKATQKLEEEILLSTEKFGAYYVLEKGIALLHAPAGKYCLKAATSTLILNEEIIFNNQPDKVAKIIITLSAPDNNSHFELIAEFGNYFMNQEFKQRALNVKSKQEFLDLITQFGEKYEL